MNIRIQYRVLLKSRSRKKKKRFGEENSKAGAQNRKAQAGYYLLLALEMLTSLPLLRILAKFNFWFRDFQNVWSNEITADTSDGRNHDNRGAIKWKFLLKENKFSIVVGTRYRCWGDDGGFQITHWLFKM